MNFYYLEMAYNNIWNVKKIYDAYYYPYTLITPKNVYKLFVVFYPYLKDTTIHKVLLKNKQKKEDIKLNEL